MSVTLRKIRESDLETIMNWRMDPEITRYMNTDPRLTLEGQKNGSPLYRTTRMCITG